MLVMNNDTNMNAADKPAKNARLFITPVPDMASTRRKN